jgi:phasin
LPYDDDAVEGNDGDRTMQSTRFEIPENMRQMADRSVDQAKKAFEQFLDATQKAVATAEGSAKSMREGTADVNRQALAFIEDNVAASFDFAQRLVQARTVEEMAALQQEFVKRQMSTATSQGQQLSQMMGKAATSATKPPAGQPSRKA